MEKDEHIDDFQVMEGDQTSIAHLTVNICRTNVDRHFRICPDDPVFSFAAEHRSKWQIEPNCLRNHLRLISGYRQLPVILMLNPCRNHSGDFRHMFGKNSALAWLERVFDKIGLDIEDDVSIWDIWPMISDEWLEKMARDGRQVELQNAVLQSYELVGRYLERFRPPAIVVLQCSTCSNGTSKYPFLENVRHPLAQVLCSSMGKAVQGDCEAIRYRDYQTYVIPGFHPSAIEYEQDQIERKRLATTLESILFSVYQPYVSRMPV
ncbi:uncharacterized protein N7446_005544 [Penicillium canescens]|uniref:uncharacterized protein n=1 Tax=Penicillium canescens TaxID=5083 RepID=UPI0026DF9DBD|nr:uncharacterized protein N7446_005544 [Penicillium canescens]KAJ6061424.1 hypothetical protein N7446_005544 [Penicillium canescens]